MTRSVVQLGGQALKLDADGDTTIEVSSDDVLVVDTAGNEALKIDANGHVTKPLQSAFLANPAAAGASPVQNNISSGDTITFGTEIFDQNGDFASNTFTCIPTPMCEFACTYIHVFSNNMACKLAPSRVPGAQCAADVAYTCVRALSAPHTPPVNLIISRADQPAK